MKKYAKAVSALFLSAFIAVIAAGCTAQNNDFNSVTATSYNTSADSDSTFIRQELVTDHSETAAQVCATYSIKAEKSQHTKIFR